MIWFENYIVVCKRKCNHHFIIWEPYICHLLIGESKNKGINKCFIWSIQFCNVHDHLCRILTAMLLTLYYLEQFLTLTVWWAIPVIWLPVVCWLISVSARMGLACPHITVLVVLGIFVWTLIEYSLHRFLFHIKTKSYWLDIFSNVNLRAWLCGMLFYKN